MSELSRKDNLKIFIESRTTQINEGVPLDRKDVLEQEIAVFQKELDEIEELERIAGAHENRVEESTIEAKVELESIEVHGMPFRVLFGTDEDYSMGCAEISRLLTTQATKFSEVIRGYEENELQIQRQNKELQTEYENLTRQFNEIFEDNRKWVKFTSDLVLEKEDAEQKRDAAVIDKEEAEDLLNQADEKIAKLETEIQRLEAKVDEQRREIANGVRGEIKVIDIEAERILAEKIKAQKTIYDLVPDSDINPKSYSATLALTGERISFNWTLKNSYIILKDESEIEQFRFKHITMPATETFQEVSEPVETEVIPDLFQEADGLDAVQSDSESGAHQDDAAEGTHADDVAEEQEDHRTVNENVTDKGRLQFDMRDQRVFNVGDFEQRIQQIKQEIKHEIVNEYGLIKVA